MQLTYIVIIVIVIFAIILGVIYSAGTRILDLYSEYDKVASSSNINTISLLYFLRDVFDLDFDIKRIHGRLSDCYVPSKKIIAVSDATFNNCSIAAISVVSHEVGHAIQHKNNKFMFNLHRLTGAIVSIFGKLVIPTIIKSIILILLGIYSNYALIAFYIAIAVFILGILYKFLTIPIEYSASSIALNFLKDYRILNDQELKIAKKITNAAAFTYVAEFVKDILGLNLLKRRD